MPCSPTRWNDERRPRQLRNRRPRDLDGNAADDARCDALATEPCLASSGVRWAGWIRERRRGARLRDANANGDELELCVGVDVAVVVTVDGVERSAQGMRLGR